MGIEKKLVDAVKYAGKGICKYTALGSLIGASVLNSAARAEINMENILDCFLDNNPAVKYETQEEWRVFAECGFQGPEFDSGEVLSHFERQGRVMTREEFRNSPNAYTETGGVLTMNGDAGTGDSFGTEIRNGSQRVSAYFNSCSLEQGEGSVALEMTNDNPDDKKGIYVGVFNTDSHGFTIQSAAYIGGKTYPLFEPISYSGQALRLTKDDESGFTDVEFGTGNDWHPVAGADVLSGTACRAKIVPVFYDSAWKPQLIGLVFEAQKRSCDINSDGSVDAVDIQRVINQSLGYGISPYDLDINSDGSVDALDVQKVINSALGRNQ